MKYPSADALIAALPEPTPDRLRIFEVDAYRDTGEWIGEARDTGTTIPSADWFALMYTGSDPHLHLDVFEQDDELRAVRVRWVSR